VNELHLFAGCGGGILGGMLLGHRTVCAVEIEPYCRKVLLQRQRDGVLPWFPIWDDVRTFDGRPWRGIVDVVCGGFPCQDISAAGKGAGIDGDRSGLWSEMARIIGEVRPRHVFVENSPALAFRGLDRVLGDLSEMGYDAKWGVVSAADAGAPHLRERIWILADAKHDRISIGRRAANSGGQRIERSGIQGDDGSSCGIKEATCDSRDPDTEKSGLEGSVTGEGVRHTGKPGPGRRQTDWWETEPAVGRVVDGMAHRVDRLKAIGNGQVPAVAALAWRILEGMK